MINIIMMLIISSPIIVCCPAGPEQACEEHRERAEVPWRVVDQSAPLRRKLSRPRRKSKAGGETAPRPRRVATLEAVTPLCLLRSSRHVGTHL